jgi:hypothetical protein
LIRKGENPDGERRFSGPGGKGAAASGKRVLVDELPGVLETHRGGRPERTGFAGEVSLD